MKKGKMRNAVGVLAASFVILSAMPTSAAWWNKGAVTAEAETKTAYAFTYKETVINLNQEAAPVIKALGGNPKCFEQQSCAYQGMDRIYTYEGFELGTYPVNGKDCISSVYFLDNTVATQEGIKIGSSYEDMVKAYGKDYKEQNGVYRYRLGNSELSIYTTNGTVDAVEYQVITE